jgi:putative N6-adenine-specific DNA methylase
LALHEIERWKVPGLQQAPEVSRGGITLHLASLSVGFELNRVLKIPTRILLRIAKFGCRDFPKLFKKVSALPWENWVSEQDTLSFHASSHGSRLAIKKRIEATCDDARVRYLRDHRAKSPENQADQPRTEGQVFGVLVRIDDDVCTISLDTSGELLHKRGMRPLSSDAPIRETVASALLQFLERTPGPVDMAKKPIELVDPMMGTGTFFLEAMLIRERIESRDFAFEDFPASRSDGEILQTSETSPYESFYGFDLSEKTLGAAQENLADIFEPSIAGKMHTRCADIFTADAMPAHSNRWLITNPPYGERLKISVPLAEYYAELFVACERAFSPARACFVLPEKSRPLSLKIPSHWRRAGDLAFSNGGLPVRAVVYERKHPRG